MHGVNMARKRWGDRFSENWAVDGAMGVAFLWFVAFYFLAAFVLLLLFTLSLTAGILPETKGGLVMLQIKQFMVSQPLHDVAEWGLASTIISALFIISCHLFSILLNILDKFARKRGAV